MEELLKVVDEIDAYFGAAGDSTSGGSIATPVRLARQLRTARRALNDAGECPCRKKH